MESVLASRETILAFTIFLFVILPSALLLWLGRSRAKDRLTLLSMALLVTSLFGVVYVNQPTWYHLSGHLRWILVIGYLFALAAVGRRARRVDWRPQLKPMRKAFGFLIVAALSLFFAAALLAQRVDVASARAYEGKALELHFPLKHANALIVNGGSSFFWNGHALVPGQRYALDITALDPVWKRRARGVYPGDLSAYVVYGAEVVAPCSGTVAATENGMVDQIPPSSDRKRTAGNHVLLHCGGRSALLAHLRPGSVRVGRGQHVKAGQVLGAVGNSGNTSEPHLHIEVVDGLHYTMDELNRATAVPMLFHGRFLIRGDIVDGRS